MANVMLHRFFITTTLLAMLSLSAGVPARYYTEFQVSEPVSPTMMADVYAFLEEFCQAVPLLCSAQLNVTVTDTGS